MHGRVCGLCDGAGGVCKAGMQRLGGADRAAAGLFRLCAGGLGTGDLLIVADKVLTVIDLKYGKGVAVDAERNPIRTNFIKT